MKYLGVKHLFYGIISLIQTLCYFTGFILFNVFKFLWEFKVSSWYDFYHEPEGSNYYHRTGCIREDKNPIECFIRLYKIYTGTYYNE